MNDTYPIYLKLADEVSAPEHYLPKAVITDDLCIITGQVRINKEFRNGDIIAYLPEQIWPKYNQFAPCFYQNMSTFDKPKMIAFMTDGRVLIAHGGVYRKLSHFYFTGHAYSLV